MGMVWRNFDALWHWLHGGLLWCWCVRYILERDYNGCSSRASCQGSRPSFDVDEYVDPRGRGGNGGKRIKELVHTYILEELSQELEVL